MKTYKNIYNKIYSIKNLKLAYKKAKDGKENRDYVKKFKKNLDPELKKLQEELKSFTYSPRNLNRFIVRDPKNRVIHSSNFRDRVVYHALVNLLEPIFEKVFIHDSYASRKNKGVHKAILRFDKFKRKVSQNGILVKNASDNNLVKGYVLKADIRKYFDTVDHGALLKIIKRKIQDEKVIWLIKQILNNFNTKIKGKGMPLGNLTSQFFANVYLNELDYFIKYRLRTKYYIRYVDDFVIFNKDKKFLEYCKIEISNYLTKNLKLDLHPEKSNIIPLRNGITFLGYKIFYHHKLLKKSNKINFYKNLDYSVWLHNNEEITYNNLLMAFKGWEGYAIWADTYNMRKLIYERIESLKLSSQKHY